MAHDLHPQPVVAKRRGPRGDLSREGLVEVASHLLEQVGPHGLTQRAVADAAGVAPAALYTYFTDMADLRMAVGDAFIATWPLDALSGPGTARERIVDLVSEIVTLCMAHPHQTELLVNQVTVGPASMTLNESLRACLMAPRPEGPGMGVLEAHDLVVNLMAWFFGHLGAFAAATSVSRGSSVLDGLPVEDRPLTHAGYAAQRQREADEPGSGLRATLRLLAALIPE